MVTRPTEDADELAGPLRNLGAAVVLAPAIRLEPADRGAFPDAVQAAAVGRFEWVAFTSAAGVRAWAGAAQAVGAPTRPAARIAAVGSGTAEALRTRGVDPDLLPTTFTTAALGQAFPSGGGEVLLPRADLATSELEEALAAKGWTPVRVDAYRIAFADRLPEEATDALTRRLLDAVTFTSSSTVRGLARLTGERPSAACIGPVTADTARRAGFPVNAVADPHTVEGLVQAILAMLPGA